MTDRKMNFMILNFKLKRIVLFIIFLFSTGCMSSLSSKDTPESRQYALKNPTEQNVIWINSTTSKFTKWYSHQENILLSQGRPLSDDEIEIARKAGIKNPEKIRLLVLNEFPTPDDPVLKTELNTLGFNNPNVGGLTIGYAILLKPKYEHQKWILAHECVHVAQREKLGTKPFIRQYLSELKIVGYNYSPLELEANKFMAQYE